VRENAVIAELPPAGGSYVLLVPLATPLTLDVGRLGRFDFPTGTYAYVGSAQGPGGLRARVGRHLRADKALRWHVDFLTAAAPVTEVWIDASAARLECAWSGALAALPGVRQPVPGFGASDCACLTHQFLFPADRRGELHAALGNPRAITVSR
jgi:Uri superfamily endonuclease